MGTRRVHALLRQQGVGGTPRTVARLLRRHGWLSAARQQVVRSARRHEGQVAVAEPNRRWASDITGLQAWNGEKRRLAVILDCADRMVLAWRAGVPCTAEDLCERLREALWQRCGADLTRAQGLECLSDHGPEYKAPSRRDLLARLGLAPCRTPSRSPESNGIAERFFGSLTRDYVYQSGVETGTASERQVPGWIQDDNEVAPHSALGMRSPAQLYREWTVKNGFMPVQK